MNWKIHRNPFFISIVASMILIACGTTQNQNPDSTPLTILATFTPLSQTVTVEPNNISNPPLIPSIAPDPTEINMEFVQDGCPTFGMHPAKPSPDGLWLASECFDGENAHVRIARFDRTKVWDLNFQDITGVSPCVTHSTSYGETVCFRGILYIDHWFKTGRYVFVSADYLIDRGFTFRRVYL